MANYVQFTLMAPKFGSTVTIDVNADDPNISDLQPVPASKLPSGVAAATYINYTDGRSLAVRGTVAATVALLTAVGNAVPILLFIDGATGAVTAGNAQATAYGVAGAHTAAGEVTLTFTTPIALGTGFPQATPLEGGAGYMAGVTITDTTHMVVHTWTATAAAADADTSVAIFLST